MTNPATRESALSRISSRRELLTSSAGGFGSLALASLLSRESRAADPAKSPHHVPRAKRVIQLFMNGGASPMDTFDHKPALERLHGRKFDPGSGKVESVTGSPGFKVLKSPFEFRRYGECGRSVSSVIPHVAKHVDKLGFLMSMASKTNVHGPASYMQNTGFTQPGFPCAGAWISYALGNESEDLPSFVVIPDHRGFPYNNRGNFSAAFLPAKHQGTILEIGKPRPIADIHPPSDAEYISPESESSSLRALPAPPPRAPTTRASKRASRRTSSLRACSSARPKRSTCLVRPPRRRPSTVSTNP